MDNIQITYIPSEDIFIDEQWNSRSGDWKSDDEYQTLIDSIKEEGIKSPLEIKPYSSPKNKCSYFLVAGFRRLIAAKELGIKEVPCIINDLTEIAARIRNIQENTQRANLRVQDLCYAIGSIRNSATQKELSIKTGIAQSQVCKFIKIYEGLKPSIFKKWRIDLKIKIPIQDIYEIAGNPKDRQDELFQNLIIAITNNSKSLGRGSWIRLASRKVHQQGIIIGRLLRRGLVGKVETDVSQWNSDDVRVLLEVPKTISIEKIETLISVFCKAVKQGNEE